MEGAGPRGAAIWLTDSGTPATEASARWISGAPAQGAVLQGSSEELHVAVWIETPEAERTGARAPVALSLVIDSSGSMSGDKILHAKRAAASLIESLASGDIVSIYTFSDGVIEIASPTVVEPGTSSVLISQTRDIEASGSTNLFDGLRVGEDRAGKAPKSHPVRRVVVISDGQANVGPSSPGELGDVAARGTEAGVQVSAIGVGLDYDERTLGALAVRSSGRLYHLQDPAQMTEIVKQELKLLNKTAATAAYLEITPAPGVEILGAEIVEAQMDQGTLRVGLGTLYAGQRREVLLRVKAPVAEAPRLPIATARLFYRTPADIGGGRFSQSVPIEAKVTTDAAEASRSENAEVEAMIVRYEAAQAQLRASAMLNEGRNVEAADVLEQAEQRVQKAAESASSPAERSRLQDQAARIGETKSDAKKANTKTQSRETALKSYNYAFDDGGY
jgi:Ca-activated chloride channel family protein